MNQEAFLNLLGIKEEMDAPSAVMSLLYGDKAKRDKFLLELLELWKFDVSKDQFHDYFQESLAQRKTMKQDFTPSCVGDLLAQLVGGSKEYYEVCAGTGGICINYWNEQRMNASVFNFKPSEHLFILEELSHRTIPFLLLNLIIRGMNAVVIHIDTLTRKNCQGVFFIQNQADDCMMFSDMNVMPYSDVVAAEFNIQSWGDKRYRPLVQSVNHFKQHETAI